MENNILIREQFSLCKNSKRLKFINFKVEIESQFNINKWKVTFEGPKKTAYENGLFKLSIDFPPEYPEKAPKIRMMNKTFHPNIHNSENAQICINSLSPWNKNITIEEIILSIYNLLSEPNPHSYLNQTAARLYLEDIKKYNEEVKKLLIFS